MKRNKLFPLSATGKSFLKEAQVNTGYLGAYVRYIAPILKLNDSLMAQIVNSVSFSVSFNAIIGVTPAGHNLTFFVHSF